MRKLFLSYSLAFAVAVLAVLARWLLDPVLGDTFPLVTLFGAVAVAVWFGGMGPGIVASLLGVTACEYLFVPPRGSFGLGRDENIVGLLASLLTCIIIIAFGERTHVSRRRFEEVAKRPTVPTAASAETMRRRYRVRDIVAASFGLVVFVLVATGVLGYRNVQRLQKHDRWVEHTQDVIDQLQTLMATLTNAETGHRGYLLTSDQRYLTPYQKAIAAVPDVLVRLGNLTADNREQRARLNALRPRAEAYLAALQHSIDRAENGDGTGAQIIVADGSGRMMMDDLRARVASMEDAENDLLRRRSAESRYSANSAVLWIILGTLIGMILVGGVFFLTQRNIRLRQEVVDAVAEHRDLLRVTLASIGDAVITTDLEDKVTYLNGMAEKLTGWTSVQAAGQPLAAVFRIAKEEANHSVMITKDDAEVAIDTSRAPITDELGRVAGSVLVFRDITELKAAEAQLQDADRRKDEFLAMLAHELRGPLAPLGNVLEIMKHADREDGPMRQLRGTIERQVRQLVRLVDDLLDVSRITRGRLELRRERVELGSILRQAIETCRPLADAQGQQISVTVPPEPIYLEADRARLAQVFYNLLHNASKYTPREGHIWLMAERTAYEIVVRVRDNGVGIEPEMMAIVFEPFRQAPQTFERSQGGLGIGLTLARRLVDMHGGTLMATSGGAGKGSEFTVRLPVTRTATPPSTPRLPPMSQPVKKRVLVVDDNQDSAMSLAALLRMEGAETHLAHDGEEAVTAAETLRPEVVLLDIGLPKLNGYDVCRRIRSTEWGKDVLLVALTGWGQAEDRRQAREAGFDHHMVKPVDYTALSEVLSRADR